MLGVKAGLSWSRFGVSSYGLVPGAAGVHQSPVLVTENLNVLEDALYLGSASGQVQNTCFHGNNVL